MNAAFEEYETDRIREHMADPSATIESLLKDVRAFTGDFPASDDITLVIVRT